MTSQQDLPGPVIRIIDANLNRIGEGLRLLEDIARLLLDDAEITQEIKAIRHNVLELDWPTNRQLLQHRNSEQDVGLDMGDALKKRELPLTVVANARRVQESLRVVEELAKIPNKTITLKADNYKQARFQLYSLEQKLLSHLSNIDTTGGCTNSCI